MPSQNQQQQQQKLFIPLNHFQQNQVDQPHSAHNLDLHSPLND
jgi:hypothetical protein